MICPTCGVEFVDLGAEVIKTEQFSGDNTCNLPGSGARFFLTCSIAKNVAIDLCTPTGLDVVQKLIATADIANDNFRLGTIIKLGPDCGTMSKINNHLTYANHKGFLQGS